MNHICHSSMRLLTSLALLLVAGSTVHGETTLLGLVTIAGDAPDRLGKPGETLGGLSAICPVDAEGRYVLLSDRGPGDGQSDYHCRVHVMEIQPKPRGKVLSTKLLSTTLLHDGPAEPFVGSLTALGKSHNGTALRLDPEGICVGPRRTYFISDEYGPCIHEFDRQGKRLRSLNVPDRFLARAPAADPDQEQAGNRRGRVPNRGLEGLTITSDGSRLLALMQSPLIQDGGREGTSVRLLEIDLVHGSTREFVYPLDSAKLGLNEILAINGHEFLVIERDGKEGTKAKVKKLYQIDTSGATDVSAIESLSAPSLNATSLTADQKSARFVPVRKKLFLDMLDPRFGLAGSNCPGKLEGLCFGPDLPDGRHLLLLTSDNDFQSTQPSRIYAFAIDRQDLPEFERARAAPAKPDNRD
ncbi:MAG: esterase-like activity of phytase family protein [Planctomycetia bacterium]|nr:esterase-like activity of phytase family protein [Planctomycetia bacterium]